MSIKSAAKKVGKALIFQKLYAEFKANKENGSLDELKQHIEEWKADASNDLNCILASILVQAEEGSIDDVQAEVEKAKSEYGAEDLDLVPWFESQIETIEAEKEEGAAAE